jgi:hypothetical protein
MAIGGIGHFIGPILAATSAIDEIHQLRGCNSQNRKIKSAHPES